MTNRRFLAGFLALGVALSLPSATGQARSIAPPAPATAPTPLPTTTPLTPAITPAPVTAPPPVMAPQPSPVVRYEPSRGAESREYSFEDDTVSGDLARPEAAASSAAPPDVPAYSDLCKASPKPPWCSDATRGNGN